MAEKTNPNTSPLTGSVIIDGTSYSGADIKVVVSYYDNQGAALERRRELDELMQTSTDANVIEAAIEEHDKLALDGIKQNKVLAEVQTLSVSTFREKHPVRSLGTVYPKSFTRGTRTIAGSMVFTVFDQNVLYELLQADATEFDSNAGFTAALIDQLPPLTIDIAFANELGQLSVMSILGVEFVDEGQTMSIHDLFIENQVRYVARDVDPMRRAGEGARRDENMRLVAQELQATSGSDLLNTSEALAFKNLKSAFSRFNNRNNPFD